MNFINSKNLNACFFPSLSRSSFLHHKLQNLHEISNNHLNNSLKNSKILKKNKFLQNLHVLFFFSFLLLQLSKQNLDHSHSNSRTSIKQQNFAQTVTSAQALIDSSLTSRKDEIDCGDRSKIRTKAKNDHTKYGFVHRKTFFLNFKIKLFL